MLAFDWLAELILGFDMLAEPIQGFDRLAEPMLCFDWSTEPMLGFDWLASSFPPGPLWFGFLQVTTELDNSALILK